MKSIDFLPERIKEARARTRRLRGRIYLLVACVCALAMFGYARHGQINYARAELLLLTQDAENMYQQLALRSDLERQEAELMIKKHVNDQLGSRIDALDVLGELGRLLPKSIALTSLDLEARDVSLPVHRPAWARARAWKRPVASRTEVKKIKRVQLIITGIAPADVDVASFIGYLSASPLFEDVKMGYIKTVIFRGCGGREFQTSCYVVK